MLGALLGWFFGLFSLIDPLVSGLQLALWGAVIGAILGAIVGAVAHAATGGQRDFASISGYRADHYELQVDEGYADEPHSSSNGCPPDASRPPGDGSSSAAA